ncbi:MAG: hypothetical protein F6K16_03195 [Symploca sp. SIO2B6]|nr:hypothetical protein [Symploca sp. SIO2B6]
MSYFLRLISLEANKTGADGFFNDDDETYIQLNGERIWEDDLETGDVIFFDNTDGFVDDIENSFFFENFVTVSLYDEDEGLFGITEVGGNDDFLGSHIIQPITVDPFLEVVNLNESGSEYTLTYEVIPWQV